MLASIANKKNGKNWTILEELKKHLLVIFGRKSRQIRPALLSIIQGSSTIINLWLFCNWLELRVMLGFKNENVNPFSNIMFNRHL